ncbi:MAG: hypothetical protein MJ234_05495, partial [bacterium]|nr:hypothetical protein [bacterium]
FSDSSKDEVPSFSDSSKDEASEDDMTSSDEEKPVDSDSENQESAEGDAEQASGSETDSEDGEEEVSFASYTFEPIAHVKGSTPYSLYAANREAVSISGILKDNGQYFVKTADEIQDGFHWSEMFDFTPVNFVKMPQKSAKNDAELLSAGKIRRKA